MNVIALLVGGVALWWMVRKIGAHHIWEIAKSVGYWAILVLFLDLISLACDARALRAFMRPEARMIPFWRVLLAQAGGRGINVLTPGGALGEPLKLGLLSQHGPRRRVLSSLVLWNIAEVYISMLVLIIGTPIVYFLLDLPTNVKVLAGIGLAIVIPAAIGLFVLVHRGAIGSVVGILHRVRIIGAARAADWKKRVADVDKHIRQVQEHREHGAWKGILWLGLARLLTWGGTFTLLAAVGAPLTATLLLGVVSLGVLVQWVANIIPMGVGLSEGGSYGLYALLGASGPTGVAVAMLNRVRSVALALLGLVGLLVLTIDKLVSGGRLRRRLRAKGLVPDTVAP